MDIFLIAKEATATLLFIVLMIGDNKANNSYINSCLKGNKPKWWEYAQIPIALLFLNLIFVAFGTKLYYWVSGIEPIRYSNEIQLYLIVILSFISFLKFFLKVDGNSKTDLTAKVLSRIEIGFFLFFLLIISHNSKGL